MQIKREKKLSWTGFEPRASDLLGRLLSALPLKIRLPTWAPIYLATANISYNTGLHNVEKLTILQLAVWW